MVLFLIDLLIDIKIGYWTSDADCAGLMQSFFFRAAKTCGNHRIQRLGSQIQRIFREETVDRDAEIWGIERIAEFGAGCDWNGVFGGFGCLEFAS
jgi:hypothetical protein